eukprot:CAMPEP_0174725872 /NCGR_PEP_ID=MMETSP1094-20130205/46582_1 /TAXON_ID=156173 /ORGANISM="Chrysochromulina brevifilum, Strain UTEX LB 985" /LENGTH=240 /DNA_ID=CAMNT_0015927353 /DNA_START=27 /DNA_END=749 /DNA_ORIENTATION=+
MPPSTVHTAVDDVGEEMTTVITMTREKRDKSFGLSIKVCKRAGSEVLKVTNVHPDSPAAAAGITLCDTIIGVDRKVTNNELTLRSALAEASGDFPVQLVGGCCKYMTLNEEGRAGMALQPTASLEVAEVRAGSPAMRSGLRKGDEIVSINGKFHELLRDAEAQFVNDEPVHIEVRLPRLGTAPLTLHAQPKASTSWLGRLGMTSGLSSPRSCKSDENDTAASCTGQAELELCGQSVIQSV